MIKHLKLNKPCQEKWENMASSEKGNFCELCSKTVVDFTGLDQEGILDRMRFSKGKICARLTSSQLDTPLFDLQLAKEKRNNLPYSKIAAGLMIATSLTANPAISRESNTPYQIVQTTTETNHPTKKTKKHWFPKNRICQG